MENKQVSAISIYNNHNGQFTVSFNSNRYNLQAHLFYQVVKTSARKWRINIYFYQPLHYVIKLGHAIMSNNKFSDGKFLDFDTFDFLSTKRSQNVFSKYSNNGMVTVLNDLIYISRLNVNGVVHSYLYSNMSYNPDFTKIQNYMMFNPNLIKHKKNNSNDSTNKSKDSLIYLHNLALLTSIDKHYQEIGKEIKMLKNNLDINDK